MPRMLMLVRHGKAEAAQEGQADRDRSLTKAGKRSLKATLPAALEPVRRAFAADEIRVWASPALRACQTARIVCDALGVKDFQRHDVLVGSDSAAMLDEARADGHGLLVLVGHTPTLDKVSEAVCGTRMPLKPGAICLLDLTATTGKPEALRYFRQGPQVARWEALVDLEQAVRTTGSGLTHCYHAFVDDPADVETLHDLRIAIRTLRSLLAFARPWTKAHPTKRALEDLRELAALTSRLRELDVFAQLVATLDPAAPDLAASCAELRERYASDALASLASHRMQHVLGNVQALALHLPWKDSIAALGLDPAAPSQRFADLCATFDRHLQDLDPRDVEATHAVRKDAKLLRYVSRCIPDLLAAPEPGTPGGVTSRMHAIQDQLGELCDARANVRLAADFPAALSDQALLDLTRLGAQEEKRGDQLLSDLRE